MTSLSSTNLTHQFNLWMVATRWTYHGKNNCTLILDNYAPSSQTSTRLVVLSKEFDILRNDQLKVSIIEVIGDPDEKVPTVVHYTSHVTW